MTDKLRMDFINSLPQPILVRLCGDTVWWPVNDFEVETALLRIDVVGVLEVKSMGEVVEIKDGDHVAHAVESFYSDWPEAYLDTAQMAARELLSRCTSEQPLLVGPEVHAAMSKEICFSGMMDRVRVYESFAGRELDTAWLIGAGTISINGEENAVSGVSISFTEEIVRHRQPDFMPEKLSLSGVAQIGRALGKSGLVADLVKTLRPAEVTQGHRYGPHPTDPYAPGARRRRR